MLYRNFFLPRKQEKGAPVRKVLFPVLFSKPELPLRLFVGNESVFVCYTKTAIILTPLGIGQV